MRQDQVGTGVVEVLTIIANLEGRQESVFIVEEPELHLHPHQQRLMSKKLIEASQSNQVFVLTHAPMFIEPGELDAISRMWKVGSQTEKSSWPADLPSAEMATLRQNLRQPGAKEIFFARAVLLVEGEEEEAYLREIGPRLDFDLDAVDVSIVAVGGQDKSRYMPYMRLLSKLGIPFLCHRDHKTGTPQEWKEHFRFSNGEFQDVMKASGASALFKKAETVIGEYATHKPHIARYIGEHISLKTAPRVYNNLLQEVAELATNS